MYSLYVVVECFIHESDMIPSYFKNTQQIWWFINVNDTVLSMGPGREEENGLIQPMPNIKPGDVVIAKHPWGIGPKDEETADGKKLSFMRGGDIAAVVEGKLLQEV